MKNRSRSQTGRGGAAGIVYNYFLGQVRSYREKMVVACDGLQRVHPEFNAGNNAFRAHCDFALTSLSRFKEPVVALYALVRGSLVSPVNSEHYYPLMLSLSQAIEQSLRLLSLVSAYRQVCQTYSPQLVYQKLEIYDALEQLTECSKQTLARIEHFMNEIGFLELNLRHAPEEELPIGISYESKKLTVSDIEPQHEKVIVLQQRHSHFSHHHPRSLPQTGKTFTCSLSPAQQDTL